MLRARCISEGIRTVWPGVSVGVYTPEEIQDFETKPLRDGGAAEVVETVEMPRAKEPETPQEPGALSQGQKKVLWAKVQAAGLDMDGFAHGFGKALGDLVLADFKPAIEWLEQVAQGTVANA